MNHLPKDLAYLEPVMVELGRLVPDELDEDVDLANIEAVLRQRVGGLRLREAVSRLKQDHALLEQWLKKTKPRDGAVLWIAGFLARPGPLARHLLAPPPPPEPTVSVEPPEDWQARACRGRMDIWKNELWCSIIVLDKSEFAHRQCENNHREELQKSPSNPWANLGVWSKSTVELGKCRGEKLVYLQSGKGSWKQVTYLLEVPGGYVDVHLGRQDGKQFDETEVERQLHTVKVNPPVAVSSLTLPEK